MFNCALKPRSKIDTIIVRRRFLIFPSGFQSAIAVVFIDTVFRASDQAHRNSSYRKLNLEGKIVIPSVIESASDYALSSGMRITFIGTSQGKVKRRKGGDGKNQLDWSVCEGSFSTQQNKNFVELKGDFDTRRSEHPFFRYL